MRHTHTSIKVLFASLAFGLTACWDNPNSINFPDEVEGYRPIYFSTPPSNEVLTLAAEPLERPGKIYVYGDLLLINERGRGIHVLDNANPSDPVNLYFIKINGNVDMAMKDGVLYADNMSDLVVLKIDRTGVKESKRMADVFNVQEGAFPPNSGYFECVDNSKGYVIGWEDALLKKPECFR